MINYMKNSIYLLGRSVVCSFAYIFWVPNYFLSYLELKEEPLKICPLQNSQFTKKQMCSVFLTNKRFHLHDQHQTRLF